MARSMTGQRRQKAAGTRPGAPRQTIQVIARAASILRALEGEEAGLSLGQIAERVGLARSTVQRIVESLSKEQFVIAAAPSARVRLGPALVRIASSASLEINQIVRPIITELSRASGETVDLSMLKGGAAVFIDQVTGTHRLRAVSAVGESFPLHCTANGKALLGLLPNDEARRLLKEPLPRPTRNTLRTAAAVMRQVEACRRRGFAVDNEEHTEGISAVGTAFFDLASRQLALSIPAPTLRFQRRRRELTEQLLAARARIVEALGSEPRAARSK